MSNLNLTAMSNKNQTVKITKKSNNVDLNNLQDCQQVIIELISELDRVRQDFEIEKNIKNNLYAFISEQGLDIELEIYSRNNDMASPEGHAKAVRLMIQNFNLNNGGPDHENN
jgi:hypothetical protein